MAGKGDNNMARSKEQPEKMIWRHPSAKQRNYELVSGDSVLATLSFAKFLGSLAEAQVGGTAYSLKREGFLRPKITVRKAPFEHNIGVMEMSWRGNGKLEMSNGPRYYFKRVSAWRNQWNILDDNGRVLAEMGMRKRLLHNEANVTVIEKTAKESDLLLLLTLGWYMMLLILQDSAAAAGGGA